YKRQISIDETLATLQRGIAAWVEVDCGGGRKPGLRVEVLAERNACERAVHHPKGANVHALIFVQEGWSRERGHDPRAFAITYVWHEMNSGEILDVDIEINEQSKRYAICPEEGCRDGRIDLPNVLTHEMGHYFGLAHSPDDPEATMYAAAEPGETSKRSLAEDDIAGICTIYGPDALTEACDPTPKGGLDLSCTGEKGCGCMLFRRESSPFSIGLFAFLTLVLLLKRWGAAREQAKTLPPGSGRARPE
ncbi:MAG: matrixin family metalloprotease, partial [Deltaproteobacteria bacterium]|nr:matrixin family metalloprotease [Deltaproteobacteria bacterium]